MERHEIPKVLVEKSRLVAGFGRKGRVPAYPLYFVGRGRPQKPGVLAVMIAMKVAFT